MQKFELPPPKDDGLLIPNVGEHSADKHHFLARYVDAFTTAMKGKWGGLHYVDIFAGAGLGRLKQSNQITRGSPLIAAQTRVPFDGLHFCEKNRAKFEALEARLRGLSGPRPSVQVLRGDANEKIGEIAATLPDGSLALAFLDPYGLHLHYETVAVLAEKRCDLIIYFPDHVDVLRNWKQHYYDEEGSNLDRVLGPGVDWRSILSEEPAHAWVQRLRNMYVQQLATLGYAHFDFERILAKGHPIYQLIYCSRHKLGAGIWRRVSTKKPDGQQTFDFGSPS